MSRVEGARPDPPDPARADALARLYDLDLVEGAGDEDLYRAMAVRAGGPILELAVGTGRLAVMLAVEGHDVTGVDVDAAMLHRARNRADAGGEAASRRLHLVEADARTVRLPDAGRYRLAFVALNSLLLMGTRTDQVAVLRSLAEHLAPGGIAVVDVWLPDAEDLVRYDGRLGLEYVRRDPDSGHTVTKLASARHDAASATIELSVLYDEGPPGGPVVRWVRQDRLRPVGADELVAMAEEAGLRTEVMAGTYDLVPLGPGDERVVLVSVRAGHSPPAAPARQKRAPDRSVTGRARRHGLV